jgi:GalNAc-alpha-(1->4)-GalNAc-alpha-(1->3)-diNAcBac-PP-undecaprenol alpha-1,4-N-acetyl-D-galactosaminyltransferase
LPTFGPIFALNHCGRFEIPFISTDKNMHLVFVISTLSVPGGTQRVLCSLANRLQKQHRVTILTHTAGKEISYYDLDPSITQVGIGISLPYGGIFKAGIRNLSRIFRLRRELRPAPDAIIAIGDIEGIRCTLAAMGLRIPVIITEHVDAHQLSAIKNGFIWSQLRKLVYPFASGIVVLTKENKAYFPERLQKKIRVIPNPVPEMNLDDNSQSNLPEPFRENFVVTVCRLVQQKRIDILLNIFAKLQTKTHLVIIGDGPLRNELQDAAAGLSLKDRVLFTGNLPNPWNIAQHAKAFILTSEFEGFPMVLLESLACGVPVIGFDCPTGPRDIVRNGKDGFLVPLFDEEKLRFEIDRILQNHALRADLECHAREIYTRFGMDSIIIMWEALFSEVVKN